MNNPDQNTLPEEKMLRHPRFLILSEPRTGSNNLVNALNAHPDLVVGNELFHPRNGIKPTEFDLVGSYSSSDQNWVAKMSSGDWDIVLDGLFAQHNGFKLHSEHLTGERIVEIANRYDCAILLMVRIDLFEQAISNFVAVRSNKWHANEKAYSSADPSPEPVRAGDFIAWLERLITLRQQVWSALSPIKERVMFCEYEMLYSGDFEQKYNRLAVMFDFLGVSRLGVLEKEIAAPAFAAAKRYLDTNAQKMTEESRARKVIENYDELKIRYSAWRMRSFNKITFV